MIDSKCLIIAGMHRSGTSLTASILQKAGLNIGDDLVGKGKGNTKGHFEDIDFVNFNENILINNDCNSVGWEPKKLYYSYELYQKGKVLISEKNKGYDWGWKDPRNTLTLEFWHTILPNSIKVFIYRSPWEVADSLFRRATDHEFKNYPENSLEIWNEYNKQILSYYTNNTDNCLLYNISDIINNPNIIIADLQKKGVRLNNNNQDLFDSKIFKSDLDPLKKQIIQTYYPNIYETYKKLEFLTKNTNTPIKAIEPSSILLWWQQNSQTENLNQEIIQLGIDAEKTNSIILLKEQELEKIKVNLSLTEENLALKSDEIRMIKNSKFWKARTLLNKLLFRHK